MHTAVYVLYLYVVDVSSPSMYALCFIGPTYVCVHAHTPTYTHTHTDSHYDHATDNYK